jgi:hypothetical protein
MFFHKTAFFLIARRCIVEICKVFLHTRRMQSSKTKVAKFGMRSDVWLAFVLVLAAAACLGLAVMM